MTPNSLSASSDIDIDALIETDGCSSIFYALETCLAENNRDWRKCQSYVQAWKTCSAQKKVDLKKTKLKTSH